jgi:hypothetical protein
MPSPIAGDASLDLFAYWEPDNLAFNRSETTLLLDIDMAQG